ncbi:acyl-CoA N-acyltransferase [Panus rudis PR-1116 ss-1]|nr:acyl-CoA N-acyltransferase [Panus rudis PR-1116 ss-1]
MSLEIRRLANPSDEELDAIANVAAAAFRDDSTNACLGGNWDLAFPFWRALVGAQNAGGENVVAIIDGKVVGHAGWFPPGHELLDTPQQAEAGLNEFVARLTPDMVRWYFEYFLPKMKEGAEEAYGKGVSKSIWHLQTLCVAPEYQGRGIGHKLVQAKEEEILATQGDGAMCLESTAAENTNMYKRWGFVEKGKSHIESSVVSFDGWFLYKDVKSSPK